MSKKRDVIIENAKVDKLVVYTNDKNNEFVQIVLSIGDRKFFICDFKQNDGLLLQVYKAERGDK